ncbi:hypothetical protein HBB16_07450 [Pseudonocardia sp. MCCB 268]|nr:hypothetical protein [Pseudonocardia cytotoxica]
MTGTRTWPAALDEDGVTVRERRRRRRVLQLLRPAAGGAACGEAGSARAALVMSVALLIGRLRGLGRRTPPPARRQPDSGPGEAGCRSTRLRATYSSFSVPQTIYEPLFDLDRNGAAVPNHSHRLRGPAGRPDLHGHAPRRHHVPRRCEVRRGPWWPTSTGCGDPASGCSCLGELRVLEGVRATGDTTVGSIRWPHAGFPVMVLGGAAGLMASPPRALAETGAATWRGGRSVPDRSCSTTRSRQFGAGPGVGRLPHCEHSLHAIW